MAARKLLRSIVDLKTILGTSCLGSNCLCEALCSTIATAVYFLLLLVVIETFEYRLLSLPLVNVLGYGSLHAVVFW